MELLIFAYMPPPPDTPELSAVAGNTLASTERTHVPSTSTQPGNLRNFHMEMNKRAPWHQTDNRKIVPAVHFPIFLLKPRRAAASNGAQQRLDSPVRTGDPHAVTPDSPQRATAAPLLVPS